MDYVELSKKVKKNRLVMDFYKDQVYKRIEELKDYYSDCFWSKDKYSFAAPSFKEGEMERMIKVLKAYKDFANIDDLAERYLIYRLDEQREEIIDWIQHIADLYRVFRWEFEEWYEAKKGRRLFIKYPSELVMSIKV